MSGPMPLRKMTGVNARSTDADSAKLRAQEQIHKWPGPNEEHRRQPRLEEGNVTQRPHKRAHSCGIVRVLREARRNALRDREPRIAHKGDQPKRRAVDPHGAGRQERAEQKYVQLAIHRSE
jgi:hypothetical protein